MRHREPAWLSTTVWWHVYPLGFTGADLDGSERAAVGGFDQLITWLDYAVDLGVTGIALGPVFESTSHGYDTVDYHRIDTRLGDRAAFDRFVGAARERGLRILLDGVFNHVGRDFPGIDGDRAGWFRRTRGGGLATFEGHDALVAFDHDRAEVGEFVTDVMAYWLDAGVDGWRLDVAYAVPPRFWAQVLPRVRERHPDAYVFGEMLHGDYADYVRQSGLDSVTQYELWKAIWSALDSRNFFELDWTLRRHGELLDTFVPYTFIGNHDVTRLATKISDARHHPHALALLMVLGGTPSIYYGDEQGWQGVKEDRIGGDDAVRPAFPADPSGLDESGHEIFVLHQQLLRLRRDRPWLHDAHTDTVTLTNEFAVFTTHSASEAVTLALALDDESRVLDLDGEVLAGTAVRTAEGVVLPAHGWTVLG